MSRISPHLAAAAERWARFHAQLSARDRSQ
jgi:hypothetical protein